MDSLQGATPTLSLTSPTKAKAQTRVQKIDGAHAGAGISFPVLFRGRACFVCSDAVGATGWSSVVTRPIGCVVVMATSFGGAVSVNLHL